LAAFTGGKFKAILKFERRRRRRGGRRKRGSRRRIGRR
jgi:hypothetical protein